MSLGGGLLPGGGAIPLPPSIGSPPLVGVVVESPMSDAADWPIRPLTRSNESLPYCFAKTLEAEACGFDGAAEPNDSLACATTVLFAFTLRFMPDHLSKREANFDHDGSSVIVAA